jgi:KaiC/GvpD/RAD55 family RecA-like ATPase
MIELYTGTPGSGKSLHVSERIYRRMMRGYTVIANFEINPDVFPKGKKKLGEFIYTDTFSLDPERLKAYALGKLKHTKTGIKEGQLLLVIDECQILFNTRDWNAKERMKWVMFFSLHRRYGYDIILVTQFDRMVDRQIRAMVEYEVKHRKIGNFGAIGFIVSWITRLLSFGRNRGLFIALTYWYGNRAKLGKQFFQCTPRMMRFYNSYKLFDTVEDGGAQAGDPPKPGQTATPDEEPHPPEEVNSGGEAP